MGVDDKLLQSIFDRINLIANFTASHSRGGKSYEETL